MSSKVKSDSRQMRSDEAYEKIRDSILAGVYPPESKLKFDVLQSDLELSASPVREALMKLSAEGLVGSAQRRGFYVAPLSYEDFQDITRIRLLLEPVLLRESIEHGDEAWESNVLNAYHFLSKQRYESLPGNALFNRDWVNWHRSFHAALNAGSPSVRLRHMTETLFDQTERYRCFSAGRRKTARDIGGEHKKLMEAALDRDADTACEMMENHLSKTAENLKVIFSSGT